MAVRRRKLRKCIGNANVGPLEVITGIAGTPVNLPAMSRSWTREKVFPVHDASKTYMLLFKKIITRGLFGQRGGGA